MSDPTLIEIANVLRVACVVGAALLTGFALALTRTIAQHPDAPLDARNPRTAARLARLIIGMAFLGTSALFMQAGRIGEPVSWYLPVNVLGVGFGLWGAGGLLRDALRSER